MGVCMHALLFFFFLRERKNMKLGEGGFRKRIGKEDMIKILYEILKNKQKEALKLKTSWLAEFTQILTNDAKNWLSRSEDGT